VQPGHWTSWQNSDAVAVVTGSRVPENLLGEETSSKALPGELTSHPSPVDDFDFLAYFINPTAKATTEDELVKHSTFAAADMSYGACIKFNGGSTGQRWNEQRQASNKVWKLSTNDLQVSASPQTSDSRIAQVNSPIHCSSLVSQGMRISRTSAFPPKQAISQSKTTAIACLPSID
jgi:hypothetical protein